MARTMAYNFTMPRDKKPAAVKKKNPTNELAMARDKKPGAVKKKKNRTDETKMNMYWNKNMLLRVLKQVHPNITITSGALEVMKNILSNVMLKLVKKSYERNLRRKNKSSMLCIRDIIFAVMEVFPPQMAKLALTAARKALTNHRVTQLTLKMDRTMSINDDDDDSIIMETAFPPQEALTDHHVTQLTDKMDRTMSIK